MFRFYSAKAQLTIRKSGRIFVRLMPTAENRFSVRCLYLRKLNFYRSAIVLRRASLSKIFAVMTKLSGVRDDAQSPVV